MSPLYFPEPIWCHSHPWQPNSRQGNFCSLFLNSMAHWPFHMVASDLADWTPAAIEGQSFFTLCLFGEVWGCHWKHAIFYSFAPCHQIRMRCSGHCSSCSWFFFVFPSAKVDDDETNWTSTSLWADKVGKKKQLKKTKIKLPANSETLHPMWGLSGFVFFYLRCLCSAISM